MADGLISDQFRHWLHDREYYVLGIRVFGPTEAEQIKQQILNNQEIVNRLREAIIEYESKDEIWDGYKIITTILKSILGENE